MKKLIGAAAFCILVSVALILLFFWHKNTPSPNGPAGGPAQVGSAPSSTSVWKAANPASNTSTPTASPPTQNEPPEAGTLAPETSAPPTNLPPEIVLEKLRRCVHQYGEMFGGNPVGTNPEITAALAGGNPRHINFLTGQPGVHINQDGELLDAWGTPYFFHQLSGSVMEIHSAGPDKIMWTSDDVVAQ